MCFGFFCLSLLLISYDWSYNWWTCVGEVFETNSKMNFGCFRFWMVLIFCQQYSEVLFWGSDIYVLRSRPFPLWQNKSEIANLCSIYSVVVWHLEVKNERTCWADSLGRCVGGWLPEHIVLWLSNTIILHFHLLWISAFPGNHCLSF